MTETRGEYTASARPRRLQDEPSVHGFTFGQSVRRKSSGQVGLYLGDYPHVGGWVHVALPGAEFVVCRWEEWEAIVL